MTTESKKTLQEICEKFNQSQTDKFTWVNSQFWIEYAESDSRVEQCAVRGLLLSPNVMRAVWGEEKKRVGSFQIDEEHIQNDYILLWYYHGSQMFFLPTIDDILTYYRDHGLKGGGV